MNRLNSVAFLLVVSGILIASNIYILIPIYEEVALGIQSSPESTVYGSSIFSLCYALGLLIFGPLSERFGRKKVLIWGLFFSSVTTMSVGFAFNEWSFYFLRGIQGFTLASFAPVAFAYTFELYTGQKRTLILALINSGFLIAGILGQLFSDSITNIIGWEFVFYLLGTFNFLIFFIGKFLMPVTSSSTKQGASILGEVSQLARDFRLLTCYGITFTLLLSFVAFYDGVGRHVIDEYAPTQDTLLFIRSVGLLGAFVSIFTGKVINNIGEKNTITLGISIAILSLGTLLAYTSLYTIAIMSVFFVSSIAILIPSIISIIGSLGKNARGTAISLYSFTLLTGASIGAIIASLTSFSLLILFLLSVFVGDLLLSFNLSKGKKKW